MSADSMAIASYARLHPSGITERIEIIALIRAMERGRVVLRRGLNRHIERETATIHKILDRQILLSTRNFEHGLDVESESWCLNADLGGMPLFFVVTPLGHVAKGIVPVSMPSVIYRAERRDRLRSSPNRLGCPSRVLLVSPNAQATAQVADSSPEGLALDVPSSAVDAIGRRCSVLYLDGDWQGEELEAEVRHSAESKARPGWIRLGLALSHTPLSGLVAIEHREQINPASRLERARTSIRYVASSVRAASARTLRLLGSESPDSIEVVDFANDQGEQIRAIVDSCGDRSNSPLVLIPPAWGKTKETLLPLAATIVQSFARARLSVSVLRFDGIRRRGESFNDPSCRFPGREHLRFTFSQGVRDIHAALDFLYGERGVQPSTVILVTFSAASVDGRRAVALDGGSRIGGWINVVGAPDLQSAMRVVSGGVDYLGGFERGLRFGLQEVQGVTVDMDYAAADAIASKMAFLEDSKRDMASIKVPISWIHGRFDAWMDLNRVRRVLSSGESGNRKLIEVPTGHQLRSSRQALEVFQLVTSEVGRMASGATIPRAKINLVDLVKRGQAERQRLPKTEFDAKGFWRDYLVGRDGHLGIELMTETSAYERLMKTQIAELALKSGDSVVDLGSGTGAFPQQLTRFQDRVSGLAIFEIDYVHEALCRARKRLLGASCEEGLRMHFLRCDLGSSASQCTIPLQSASQSAVLASLLLSYVFDPVGVLREAARVLRAGGRLVVSTLVPDADTSKIFAEGAAELRSGRGRRLFGIEADRELEPSLRSFLNDAARLLELEERGVFRFWDAPALERLVERAGFEVLQTQAAFGEPGQAIVLSARRP